MKKIIGIILAGLITVTAAGCSLTSATSEEPSTESVVESSAAEESEESETSTVENAGASRAAAAKPAREMFRVDGKTMTKEEYQTWLKSNSTEESSESSAEESGDESSEESSEEYSEEETYTEPSSEEPVVEEPTEEPTVDLYSIALGYVGSDVNSLYAAIGTPTGGSSYQDGCAGPGTRDGFLYYDGFTVVTMVSADGYESVQGVE